ncbi:MAG: DUF4344 domain-containing metallopeptidase [Pseudomonadota bacterium]
MYRILACLALITPTFATADEDRFVASNVYATFYHELAHALVDVAQVPIFGQEEDAADVLSVMLITETWDEERAVEMAYDAAFGFSTDPEADAEYSTFWGVHDPDVRRYYNLVCLFYGANPDEREDILDELGLPDERAETCPEEYDQALGSWGAVLDELAESDDSGELFLVGEDPLLRETLAEEIAWLNEEFSFPQDIPVLLDYCGEPNAFYDPNNQEIIMCIEYPVYLREFYQDALGNM